MPLGKPRLQAQGQTMLPATIIAPPLATSPQLLQVLASRPLRHRFSRPHFWPQPISLQLLRLPLCPRFWPLPILLFLPSLLPVPTLPILLLVSPSLLPNPLSPPIRSDIGNTPFLSLF